MSRRTEKSTEESAKLKRGDLWWQGYLLFSGPIAVFELLLGGLGAYLIMFVEEIGPLEDEPLSPGRLFFNRLAMLSFPFVWMPFVVATSLRLKHARILLAMHLLSLGGLLWILAELVESPLEALAPIYVFCVICLLIVWYFKSGRSYPTRLAPCSAAKGERKRVAIEGKAE